MSSHSQRNDIPENEPIRPLHDDSAPPDGRRIRGEGLAHEQDYIEERITYGGDTDDYAEAADRLEQASEDLKRATQQGSGQ